MRSVDARLHAAEQQMGMGSGQADWLVHLFLRELGAVYPLDCPESPALVDALTALEATGVWPADAPALPPRAAWALERMARRDGALVPRGQHGPWRTLAPPSQPAAPPAPPAPPAAPAVTIPPILTVTPAPPAIPSRPTLAPRPIPPAPIPAAPIPPAPPHRAPAAPAAPERAAASVRATSTATSTDHTAERSTWGVAPADAMPEVGAVRRVAGGGRERFCRDLRWHVDWSPAYVG